MTAPLKIPKIDSILFYFIFELHKHQHQCMSEYVMSVYVVFSLNEALWLAHHDGFLCNGNLLDLGSLPPLLSYVKPLLVQSQAAPKSLRLPDYKSLQTSLQVWETPLWRTRSHPERGTRAFNPIPLETGNLRTYYQSFSSDFKGDVWGRGDARGVQLPGVSSGQSGEQWGGARQATTEALQQEKTPEQEERRGFWQPHAREEKQKVQQQQRRQPAVSGGPADAARHGERARASEDSVSERGVRVPAQNHPHVTLGQTQQDTDSQTGRPVHWFPLSGSAERRAGLQNVQLQLCGARETQLRVFCMENGGRVVHVNITLTHGCALLTQHGMRCKTLRISKVAWKWRDPWRFSDDINSLPDKTIWTHLNYLKNF